MKKLSEEQISEIRTLHKGGATQTQLAKDYGVSRATIQSYIRGYYIYKLKQKKLADLTLDEWKKVAKDNYKKLANRKDAIHVKREKDWQTLEI